MGQRKRSQFSSPTKPERNWHYLRGNPTPLGRIMIASLDKELDVLFGQVDRDATAGVYTTRANAFADKRIISGNKSIHATVSPPVPNRLAYCAWRDHGILELAVSVVPTATPDKVKAIASAFPVIHIVCG